MKNKTLWISSSICLLPLLYALFQYHHLPIKLPIHFNSSGHADGYLPKSLVMIYFPIFLSLFNGLIVWYLQKNAQNCGNNKVLFYLGQWLLPILGNLAILAIILFVKYPNISLSFGIKIFIALLWVFIGNYLPKTTPNYHIGIRLPWTLQDPENWQKTHHLAGIFFVIMGFLLLLLTVIKSSIANIAFIIFPIPIIILISLYSYYLATARKKSA